MPLNKAVTVITGAGSGNGRGIALGMAAAGLKIGVADVVASSAAETAAIIQGSGDEAIAIPVDVTSRAPVNDMVDAAIQAYGRIDTPVDNAGVANRAPFLELSEEELDRVYGVKGKGGRCSACRRLLPT